MSSKDNKNIKDNMQLLNQEFKDKISAGEYKVNQNLLLHEKSFSAQWIDDIESFMPYIENIIHNPRSFLKDEKLIVPVEIAKKTSPETIRHLTINTQYIKEIDEDGNVIPEKLLTVYKEEEIATYENRFVRSLIDKLLVFIERRYQTMLKFQASEYINCFNFESSFAFDDATIDYALVMSYQKDSLDTIKEQHNKELINRVENLRKQIMVYRNSDFMVEVSKARPVYPPIQRTNIIIHDINYSKCNELWDYLDTLSTLDVEVETFRNDYKLSDEDLNSLFDIAFSSYNSVIPRINVDKDLLNSNFRVKKQKVDALDNDINLHSFDLNNLHSSNRHNINEQIIKEIINDIDNLSEDEILNKLNLLNTYSNDINDNIAELSQQILGYQKLLKEINRAKDSLEFIKNKE